MQQRRSTRTGFTLLELAVSSAVLGLVFLAVIQAGLAGNRAFRSGQAQDRLETSARRTLDRIADELKMCGLTTLAPDPGAAGTSTLEFQTPLEIAAGVTVWSDTTRIWFEYEPGDPDDGVDNDRDGFIDEGRIVCTRHVGLASEQSVVWAVNACEYLEGELPNGIDDNGNGLLNEKGLWFTRNGNTLTLRLSLAQRDADGKPIVRTLETCVRILNVDNP